MLVQVASLKGAVGKNPYAGHEAALSGGIDSDGIAGEVKAIGRGGDAVKVRLEAGQRKVIEIVGLVVREEAGGRIVIHEVALIDAEGIEIAEAARDGEGGAGTAAVLPDTVGGGAQ